MRQRLAGVAVTLAALVVAPGASAACTTDIGRGWPPAVGNYGQAVETLFNGKAQPALALTILPKGGVETGVALLPGSQDQAWTLRYSEADKRVYNWNNSARGGGVELRVDQEPDQYQVAIPAALAQRLLRSWQAALDSGVPAGRKAPVTDGEVLSFQVAGERYSGPRWECGAGKLMMKQVALLIEASDTKEKKLDRRWQDLDESLDELQQLLAGNAG
ncbi:hypothetical protein ABIA68_000466 [Stenotrophomonas rhizophila]|nr:hypothetical protein [Stenotrophomonas sp. CFBP8994]MDY0979905.1 hypothetical protein [Stenotrophomonas sp. CFBP8994]